MREIGALCYRCYTLARVKFTRAASLAKLAAVVLARKTRLRDITDMGNVHFLVVVAGESGESRLATRNHFRQT